MLPREGLVSYEVSLRLPLYVRGTAVVSIRVRVWVRDWDL